MPARTALRCDALLPGRGLTTLRSRCDPMPLENVPDGLIRYVMAEVGESTANSVISAAGVFSRRLDDQALYPGAGRRPAWIGTVLRDIELLRREFAIPGE